MSMFTYFTVFLTVYFLFRTFSKYSIIMKSISIKTRTLSGGKYQYIFETVIFNSRQKKVLPLLYSAIVSLPVVRCCYTSLPYLLH